VFWSVVGFICWTMPCIGGDVQVDQSASGSAKSDIELRWVDFDIAKQRQSSFTQLYTATMGSGQSSTYRGRCTMDVY